MRLVAEDRAYAAAEMTAFLTAWLASRRCTVVNRPTPGCLGGPGWRPEQWAMHAAAVGLRVDPIRRVVPPAPGDPPARQDGWTVTMIGRRVTGARHPRDADGVRRLAARASVDALSLHLTGPVDAPRYAGASPWPDPLEPSTKEMLLDHLLGNDRAVGARGGPAAGGVASRAGAAGHELPLP
jgi:hypothetical protein